MGEEVDKQDAKEAGRRGRNPTTLQHYIPGVGRLARQHGLVAKQTVREHVRSQDHPLVSLGETV